MRTVTLLVLAITAPVVEHRFLLAAADAKTDAIAKERMLLAGTWQAVSYALDGK